MATTFTPRFDDHDDPPMDGYHEPSVIQLLNVGLENLPANTPDETNHLIASNLGMVVGRASATHFVENLNLDEEAFNLDTETAMTETMDALDQIRQATPGSALAHVQLDPKILDEYTRLGYADVLEEDGLNLAVVENGGQLDTSFAAMLTKNAKDPVRAQKLVEQMALRANPEPAPTPQVSELDAMLAREMSTINHHPSTQPPSPQV